MAERERPFAAVIYVVREDGMVLYCTRPGTGQMAAPGGKVRQPDPFAASHIRALGESGMTAALRELHEETGVFVSSAVQVYAARLRDLGIVEVYLAYWRAYLHTEPVAQEPGTVVGWCRPEVLAEGFEAEFHTAALRAAGMLGPVACRWCEPAVEATLFQPMQTGPATPLCAECEVGDLSWPTPRAFQSLAGLRHAFPMGGGR